MCKVIVLEVSYVAIIIVETIFQMEQIVVNNQVPRKEVSFWILPIEFKSWSTVQCIDANISHNISFI